jgi:hypothetical protein
MSSMTCKSEAGHVESRGHGLGHLIAGEVADRHHGQVGELMHRTVLDSADDLDEPAESLTRVVGLQTVDLGHAVEEGDDPRVSADGGADVVEDGIETVGLDRDDDEVEGLPVSSRAPRR